MLFENNGKMSLAILEANRMSIRYHPYTKYADSMQTLNDSFGESITEKYVLYNDDGK